MTQESFEDIRPYGDDEVPAVIGRLLAEPGVVRAAAAFLTPRLHRFLPPLARALTRRELGRRFGAVTTVDGFQAVLEQVVSHVVRTTMDGLTYGGLEGLDPKLGYLFISNHRDIVLDSGLMNFALYHSGFATSRIAIGDNLLATNYASDLMRLNKSFLVRRSEKGTKSAYAALMQTSQYIRHSLAEGASVWIAQREGRAKDGYDRTDPAIVKMFALAWRKEIDGFGDLVARLPIVPVAISYEIDPCDVAKARELYLRASQGDYEKRDDEDLDHIVLGITGYKGRVHVQFGAPLAGTFADAEAVANAIDVQIVSQLKVYPTHARAAVALGEAAVEPGEEPCSPAATAFADHMQACPEPHREYLLAQYANLVRNRRELGIS